MLKVLIPIDFSAASENALRHARRLGQQLPLKIYLLYIAQQPRQSNLSKASQLKLLQDRMERFAEPEPEDLWELPKDVPIERYMVRFGTRLPNEITASIGEVHPDLIVLGVRKKYTLWQQIFGSVSTHLLRTLTVPLLIVPESAPIQEVKKIGLALDLKIATPSASTFVKKVAVAYGATLHPFAVQWVPHEIKEKRKMIHLKAQWVHALQIDQVDLFSVEQWEKGIDAYLQAQPMQWLAIYAPGKRFLELLFRKSTLRHMPLRSALPILIYFQ